MDALRHEIYHEAADDHRAHDEVHAPREKGSSTGYKMISYLKGVQDFKATLSRKYPKTRDAVVAKLNELNVRFSDIGYGRYECTYSSKGSADYVVFTVKFVTNGGSTSLPGAEQWHTKIKCTRDTGSGQQFRELAKQIIHAARYVDLGHAYLDHSVTTWGLY